MDMIARSSWRCLASIFIVDLSPARSGRLVVDDVLLALQEARFRGVDVRLVIGGSRENIEIAEIADLARARAIQLGLPCRWLTSTKVRGSHSKFLIADHEVLTGSHNWSPGALAAGQTQDSLWLASSDLASYLASSFRGQWRRAGESS
jgi:phosphatidylserine/phosphatidylglycerophosphate/cardiolipin synthase-like enzyme